jgi:DNA-binding transcriptional regulator YiaG
MPDIAQVMKAEIVRLSRREVKAACSPLRKQLRALRQATKEQKQAIADLRKDLLRMRDAAPIQELGPGGEERARKTRISPASIKSQRLRLKLSQRELAKLLGVNTISVIRWETGKSQPRSAYHEELAKLRQLSRKEVVKLLEGQ